MFAANIVQTLIKSASNRLRNATSTCESIQYDAQIVIGNNFIVSGCYKSFRKTIC